MNGRKLMKKRILVSLLTGLFASSALIADDAFHPTDALLIGGNGGFNPSADDGGADLGDYASESAAPATAFHPTDALLIGGNGGFNPTGEGKGADLGGY